MIHTVNSINWVKYIGQYGPVVCSILLFILSL